MSEIEWADRYGGSDNWPDPATVCPGECDGMGVYPEMETDDKGRVIVGGWTRFVTCETCGGSGKSSRV